jgi:hypothetical protein
MFHELTVGYEGSERQIMFGRDRAEVKIGFENIKLFFAKISNW